VAATATLERPAKGRSPGSAPARPRVPFVRAAHRHNEGSFFDVTVTPAAATQAIGPFDVPSYGFARYVVIDVLGAGGALGGGAVTADYPWNIIQSVELTDPNGAYINFPVDGYSLMLENLYGGYVWSTDPAAAPGYVNTIVAPSFSLRIPIEITPWDGFGSLANQNAASAYKVRLTVNTLAALVAGGAPTAPAIRFRGYLEAWSAPAQFDLLNQPQETQPPALGTTQFWSRFQPVTVLGQNTIRLTRVGNLLRNVIIVARAVGGARAANVFPDPITLQWDSAALYNQELQAYRARRSFEVSNVAPPVGVFVYSFTDDQDGHIGFENRHLWLPTVQATRLEFTGVTGAAGSWDVLTNDVAVTPAGR